MIASDPQDNFGVPYEQVTSVKLSSPSFIVKGSLDVKYRAEGKKFGLNNKNEYNSLKTILPSISALSSKLEIK